MRELTALKERFYSDVESLRSRCPHLPKDIRIRLDSSGVGCGSAYPSDHVICRNCGKKKIVFRREKERKRKVKKTLQRQGFKDERDSEIMYDWELE